MNIIIFLSFFVPGRRPAALSVVIRRVVVVVVVVARVIRSRIVIYPSVVIRRVVVVVVVVARVIGSRIVIYPLYCYVSAALSVSPRYRASYRSSRHCRIVTQCAPMVSKSQKGWCPKELPHAPPVIDGRV